LNDNNVFVLGGLKCAFGGKPVQVSVCPPQIPNCLARDKAGLPRSEGVNRTHERKQNRSYSYCTCAKFRYTQYTSERLHEN
jgi:hypothetical protein